MKKKILCSFYINKIWTIKKKSSTEIQKLIFIKAIQVTNTKQLKYKNNAYNIYRMSSTRSEDVNLLKVVRI